tara:strand:+ start:685 stop:975 length:291 start_codon:yes stop_codon:yes gene_type:complete
MAVGDVVNGLVATGSAITFQPAAGVEVAIMSTGSYNSWTQIYNGVQFAYVSGSNFPADGVAGGYAPNIKLMINNTNYLRVLSNATGGAFYTGIQIK